MTFFPIILKTDIVISVVFTQNEDLVVTLKYPIQLGGHRSGSKYFGGKLFSFFSRHHAATMTLQCKTELDVHSASLVMHF